MPQQSKYPGWFSGDNKRLFELMSIFLNLAPDYVEKPMIDSITGGNSDFTEYAYASIAAAACGLDVYENAKDKQFFAKHFLPMFHRLDSAPYKQNPYYRNIKFPSGQCGNWTFKTETCKPYEAFVFDDPKITGSVEKGFTVIPQVGFFEDEYKFPAVLENGREWMTLMPNETNTSDYAVQRSRGKVLTFGLGLGYFTYMAAIKPDVEKVTVVELSDGVIDLFTRFILPQFPDPGKVEIVKSDAFAFAEKGLTEYDVIFTDIWHDPSDGVDIYLKMKEYEAKNPGPEYIYWVEKTLELYI